MHHWPLALPWWGAKILSSLGVAVLLGELCIILKCPYKFRLTSVWYGHRIKGENGGLSCDFGMGCRCDGDASRGNLCPSAPRSGGLCGEIEGDAHARECPSGRLGLEVPQGRWAPAY